VSAAAAVRGALAEGGAPRLRALPLAAWLRAAALALAATALAWGYAATPGVVAAALAAFSGAIGAELASRARPLGRAIRTRGALLLALVGWLALAGLASALSRTSALGAGLGPSAALGVVDALRAFAWLGAPVFALRFAATRTAFAGIAEVAVAAAALAASFAPHRAGMVHRPFAIGDFAWGSGIDPAALYLALGAAGVLVLAALLMRDERARRLPLHAAALAALALLLLLGLRITGLPTGRPPAGLGLESKGGEGDPRTQRGGRTETDFRDDYSSDGSESPVGVVVLHDDYAPPTGAYYFRETAFSQFNGRRLVEAQRDDVDRDVVRQFPAAKITVPGAPRDAYGREPLATSIGLLTDHARPFALDTPVTLEPAALKSSFRFQRSYRAVSLVPTAGYQDLLGSEAGDPSWSEAQWKLYTEAPKDARYGALAEEMLAQLRAEYRDDPLARALIVKQILEETGTYSRKSAHARAEDPTADFLFGDRVGYCVYFAHAAVYLMRELGLPARVAAGYAVNEADRGDGSAILLRGGNAHAWPEIHLAGVGWVVVDISPEKVLDDPLTPTDFSFQQMLGEMLRDQLGEPGQEPPLPTKQRALALARGLAALAAAALLASWLAKLWRRAAPRFARARALPRVAYRAALDRLAELGVRRRHGETRERFAARARALAPAFAPLTQEHLRAALGAGARGGRAELRGLAGGVARELRVARPAWRRALAWLDPISWWGAR
jgi:transglutaminase-like putative cysteine protease